MILSILLPTTPDRFEISQPLYNELQRQDTYMRSYHATLGEIEILIDDRKRFLDGGPSIGKKREGLVQRARGKYLCFIDSDDMIPGNYLETLVRACQKHYDIITFKALARLETFWSMIDMSIHYSSDAEANPSFVVQRIPSIVCPVKSVHAKMFSFEDINYEEDYRWMKQVLTKCKSENHLSEILYEYRHGAHSEADQITKAGYV